MSFLMCDTDVHWSRVIVPWHCPGAWPQLSHPTACTTETDRQYIIMTLSGRMPDASWHRGSVCNQREICLSIRGLWVHGSWPMFPLCFPSARTLTPQATRYSAWQSEESRFVVSICRTHESGASQKHSGEPPPISAKDWRWWGDESKVPESGWLKGDASTYPGHMTWLV